MYILIYLNCYHRWLQATVNYCNGYLKFNVCSWVDPLIRPHGTSLVPQESAIQLFHVKNEDRWLRWRWNQWRERRPTTKTLFQILCVVNEKCTGYGVENLYLFTRTTGTSVPGKPSLTIFPAIPYDWRYCIFQQISSGTGEKQPANPLPRWARKTAAKALCVYY